MKQHGNADWVGSVLDDMEAFLWANDMPERAQIISDAKASLNQIDENSGENQHLAKETQD
jgi:hypothetical protein